MAPEVIVDKPEELPVLLTERLETLAAEAIRARDRFAVALPGGSVAAAFLPAFARADVDWASADLFWGDERGVPPDHPESNFGVAWSLWLKDAHLTPSRTHRMPADTVDLEEGARRYQSALVQTLGPDAALDVVLMGMGPDGHICSLFPGHPLLAEEERLVAAIVDSPKPPPRRLTLTLPALASARLLVVAAFGEAKAAALREALQDPRSPLPVAIALRAASRALVLLDPAAAGR